MINISSLRLFTVLLMLAFSSQTLAGLQSSCNMPDSVRAGKMHAVALDADATPSLSHTSMLPEHSLSHCPDCTCTPNGCTLVIPSEILSCAPPRPGNLNPDYTDFPELEQISLLYRPPISR